MTVLSKLPYANQLRTIKYFIKTFGLGIEQASLLVYYLREKLVCEQDDELHLKAAMEWLLHAQSICNGQGVSNVFSLINGWGTAYPETSGYIISTYLDYAKITNNKLYYENAIQLGDWEIEIQSPDGGVLSSPEVTYTRVFNTGQVMLGWCDLYEQTGEVKYLQAAIRSGNYLQNEQESDGAWRKNTYCGARTYHARVDWALLRLFKLTKDTEYKNIAHKNLHWVLEQQHENGWFSNCGFHDDDPITHVIVYTLRGLLESSQLSNEIDILPAVIKSADMLCDSLKNQYINGVKGMVPTSFNKKWKSDDQDSCLTGNAQLACFLYRLAHITNDNKYRRIADEIISATKQTQLIDTTLIDIKGAIAGTYPLSHGYVRNGYPNWAAKFFADALLMKSNFDKKMVIPA